MTSRRPSAMRWGQTTRRCNTSGLARQVTTPAQTLINIKTFLAAGFPSMFGFPVYPEYDNPAPGGLIGYPGPASIPAAATLMLRRAMTIP